jgi:perosamine synthetase
VIHQAIPNLIGNESEYLAQCVDSTFVSSVGEFVSRFEDAVAVSAGCKGAVATSAGTTGLHAALAAVDVHLGDLVILPSYTFIGSANAISQCGATPWLIDIDPETWTLDPVRLRHELDMQTVRENGKITHRESGRRVAAIMPVYTFGLPADMDAIAEIAEEFGLSIVADGAAALGATYKQRNVSQLRADLTVFSFNGNKTVTAGGGGAISGDDSVLLDRAKHLTTTARSGPGYSHDRVGFNYRMTNLAAAVGCAQMEMLDDFVASKRKINKVYNEVLSDLPGVRLFPDPPWAESACWISGIVLADSKSALHVMDRLCDAQIEAKPFWMPMHLQAPYQDAPKSTVTVSDGLWERIVILPSSSGLSEDDQATVIKTVKKAL